MNQRQDKTENAQCTLSKKGLLQEKGTFSLYSFLVVYRAAENLGEWRCSVHRLDQLFFQEDLFQKGNAVLKKSLGLNCCWEHLLMLLAIKVLSSRAPVFTSIFQREKNPSFLQEMVTPFNDFYQLFSALRRPLSPPVDVPCSWHFSSTRAMCLFHSGLHYCIKNFSFIPLVHRFRGNPELTAQLSSAACAFVDHGLAVLQSSPITERTA